MKNVAGTAEPRWADFPQLVSCAELERYFENRKNYASTGRSFYHYTSLRALESILKKGELRLSPFIRMNDRHEQISAGNEKERIFSFCLSSGVNENLMLWYLYADRGREGVRVRFTGKMLQELMRCACEVSWYDFASGTDVSERRPLTDSEMVREIREVLYYREPGYARDSQCDLKYSTMTNYGKISRSDFALYQGRYPCFCKKIVWFQEKETRFLAAITPTALNGLKLSVPMTEDIHPALWVKLSERIRTGLRIQLAPQCPDWHTLQKNGRYNGIWDRLGGVARIKDSDYKGDICIDLCSGCENIEHEEEINK